MSRPRAENWQRTFFSGTSSCSSIRSISRDVSTSRTTRVQSTFAPLNREESASAKDDLQDGGSEAVDLVVGKAADIESAALGHIDRMVLAQLEDLLRSDRKHREH